jgi:hypothetical protein
MKNVRKYSTSTINLELVKNNRLIASIFPKLLEIPKNTGAEKHTLNRAPNAK